MTAHLNPQPGQVSIRAPERERLASLIRVEQGRSSELRFTADELRRQVAGFQKAREKGAAGPSSALVGLQERMGLVAAEGPGLVVTLDDSSDRESPSGNLNDLVIHSQDVQAVANGLWGAGAEALAVNGQRVVPTSAVLCVGNTLLINGTVHSPPFRFTALGADLHRGLRGRPAGGALRRGRRPLQAGLQGGGEGPPERPGLHRNLRGSASPGRADRLEAGTSRPMGLVLVIDNYDSFVYNLVQYLGELGADPLVYRHDEADARPAGRPRPGGGARLSRARPPRGRRRLQRRHRRVRPAGRAGARRVPRPPVHRPALRRPGGAGRPGHARQDVDDRPLRRRPVRRPAEPVRGHPVPLAGGRPGLRPRLSSRSPPRPTTA